MATQPLSRRTFLRHAPLVAAAAIPVGVAQASEPDMDFITPERAAMKLGELMCADAPGLWRVNINRRSGFVLVFHDRDAPPSANGVMLQFR